MSVEGNVRYKVPGHLSTLGMNWNYIIINITFLRLLDYVKSRSQKHKNNHVSGELIAASA
jgi:hypothetical protein